MPAAGTPVIRLRSIRTRPTALSMCAPFAAAVVSAGTEEGAA
jgi:hypothetical protein